MCGIVGCVGRDDDTVDVLMGGLRSLEYRGYDSAGIAVGPSMTVMRRSGELDELQAAVDADRPTGTLGIGHTRWSTHGPPTDANAHPHTDENGRVAVVHNGIIENYGELKAELQADGVEFTSETDTEVVPHLIAAELQAGTAPETAFHDTVDRLEGSYAIAVLIDGGETIYAARQGSPLVVGVGKDSTYLASDVPAFIEHTRDVVFLEDGHRVIANKDGYTVLDETRTPVDVAVETVSYTADETGKSGYDHYMLKEIYEQPTSLRQSFSGRIDALEGTITLEEVDEIPQPDAVQFVACGTSYHAALYGAALLRERGIPAEAYLASEYALSPPPLSLGTLVVGITQSGETADTLAALRDANGRGVNTLALTNTVNSTAARECDHAVYIRAGPEIGVAATKTFSSQLVGCNLLVEELVDSSPDLRPLIESLRDLPGDVQEILDTSRAEALVEEYADSEAYFFIGRGTNVSVALEGALKCKEISYEHAEGFPAGELKHGPLALVTPETPVFAIVTGDDERARKTLGNIKEVQARGAPVIAVTDGESDAAEIADETLMIPETNERVAPILANVQLQLFSYYLADTLGRPIDKPRNLAKSVTVE
jgi:glucosamine--fructose-6-phosphate aminotransferase (isomerizing)